MTSHAISNALNSSPAHNIDENKGSILPAFLILFLGVALGFAIGDARQDTRQVITENAPQTTTDDWHGNVFRSQHY